MLVKRRFSQDKYKWSWPKCIEAETCASEVFNFFSRSSEDRHNRSLWSSRFRVNKHNQSWWQTSPSVGRHNRSCKSWPKFFSKFSAQEKLARLQFQRRETQPKLATNQSQCNRSCKSWPKFFSKFSAQQKLTRLQFQRREAQPKLA